MLSKKHIWLILYKAMDSNGLKDRLLSVIANIEERTDSELIDALKDTLTAAGTGTSIDSLNDQYKFIYHALDERFSATNTEHPNQFDDLWAFYTYWKDHNLETYADRRAFVRSLYKNGQTGTEESFWSHINHVIIKCR